MDIYDLSPHIGLPQYRNNSRHMVGDLDELYGRKRREDKWINRQDKPWRSTVWIGGQLSKLDFARPWLSSLAYLRYARTFAHIGLNAKKVEMGIPLNKQVTNRELERQSYLRMSHRLYNSRFHLGNEASVFHR